MLPTKSNMSELVDRWFEAAKEEQVGGESFNTSGRMELFENTEKIANVLKQLKTQGNINLVNEFANAILKTFDDHIGESKSLALWVAHYTTKSKDEGAYKSLHYLFETIADIKGLPNVLKEPHTHDPSLKSIIDIDSSACDYINNIDSTQSTILPEITDLVVKKFTQSHEPKEASALKQTSRLTRMQVAQAYRGSLKDLHITNAAQVIAYAKEFGEKLTYLNISSIPFSSQELEELFKYLPALKELFAENIEIGFEGIQILASSKNLKNLTHLDLSLNPIGRKGAEALAASVNLKNLIELKLFNSRIEDGGVEAIVSSEYLKNLVQLDLALNQIGIKGTKAIGGSENLNNLVSLNLALNNIKAEGTKAIFESENLKNLLELDVSCNDIRAEGVNFIAISKKLEKLRILSLANNNLGTEGAQHIAAFKNLKNLIELNLSFNQLGVEGVKLIGSLKNLEKLNWVNLYYN